MREGFWTLYIFNLDIFIGNTKRCRLSYKALSFDPTPNIIIKGNQDSWTKNNFWKLNVFCLSKVEMYLGQTKPGRDSH